MSRRVVDECIYDLIPPPEPEDAPPLKYRSQFAGQARDPGAPSYSTFTNKGTAQGRDGSGQTMFAKPGASMGRKVKDGINPGTFLKSTARQPTLPQPTVFERRGEKKAPIPAAGDKPVMGLMTEKNFVHANAVEAMTTATRYPAPQPKRATEKKDFGEVPKYLTRVKGEVDREKTYAAEGRTMQAEAQASMRAQYAHEMSPDEKERLIAGLREKWEQKHLQYQSMPLARDTAMQIARKEACEKELKEIETAMGKLSKKVVMVYQDRHGPQVSHYAKSLATQDAARTADQMVSTAIHEKTMSGMKR